MRNFNSRITHNKANKTLLLQKLAPCSHTATSRTVIRERDFLEEEKFLLNQKHLCNDKQVNNALANLYYEMGFYELSTYYYDVYFSFELSDSELFDEFLEKRLIDLSVKLASPNYISHAIETVNKYSNHWASHSNLGNAYLTFYSFSKAIDSYKKASVLNPVSDLVNYKLGYCLFHQTENLLNISDYENALFLLNQANYYLSKINNNLDSFDLVDFILEVIPPTIERIKTELKIFKIIS